MGATLHRYLMALSGVLAGLGGLIATPGFEPLNIGATVGVAFVFAAGAVVIVATGIRSASDPQ